MPARFHGRTRTRSGGEATPEESGFGEWWAAIAVIALASLAVVALTGSQGPAPESEPTVDPAPEILAALRPAEQSLDALARAFDTLCREPVLMALELEPDCETGVITLSDELFDGYGGASLRPEVEEDVRAAMRAYLSRLRRLPAIWDGLTGIEFRGHSDPRAVRNPYTTNLVGSQQRPLGLLLFLVGSEGLSEYDREDLERLAIVSGVSYSRPPESCPEASRECYDQWRRVEIRPVLSEPMRRNDWSRTIEGVRMSAEASRQATR